MEKENEVKYIKYQQGDVIMNKLIKDDDFKTYRCDKSSYDQSTHHYKGSDDTKAIVAFGEVTGHTHRIEMSELTATAGVTLHFDNNRQAGVDVPKGFEIHTTENTPLEFIHEEHDPVGVPEGKYCVKIVREFNHITRRAQYVAD